MADLRVKYLGLDLKNPIIVSSSGLTGTVRGARSCAEAGAGAIVLKSLFEEQIEADVGLSSGSGVEQSSEATDYLNVLGRRFGPQSYEKLIRDARQETDVPIIASVNCVSSAWWTEYAKQIEGAGADALELNIAIMPTGTDTDSNELEDRHYRIVERVRAAIDIPLCVKIGPYFTSLPKVVRGLVDAGANGIVVFNRFYRMDVDAEHLALVSGEQFSNEHEMHLPLRWIALLSPNAACDLAATTGIHSGRAALKMILAGAAVVQIASVLYRRKLSYLSTMIEELSTGLDALELKGAAEARGSLLRSVSFDPENMERLQYIRALTGVE